jgi:EAL domain-containing protein (putative c-di-GMP-specific phosphodiesterase class I)
VTSLTYLRSLPVDFLKVGGPFVTEVVDDPMYGSIVRAISQIGQSLGIETIAKQVGSESIVRKLRDLGVGYAQGRAWTAPLPILSTKGRVLPLAQIA